MPEPHDFAVRSDPHQSVDRPCAASQNFGEGVEAPFVLRAARSLTENRPAITSHARRCRVHRIPSRVRDDRDTPLVRDETAGFLALIWGDREENCFRGIDWTGQITLKRLEKIVSTRIEIAVVGLP